MAWPVALYVPNLIGYVRIVTGLAAFAVARDSAQWAAFFWLYAVSYSLDAVDGVAARRLGQTSRLGAVLDMVTDRFCTAGLLCTLSVLYPAWSTTFVVLMVLDIVSHWAQMFRCDARQRVVRGRERRALGGT
jgi:CDP-diacylglycerol--inositol 3-phosphatidyltransferase